MKIYQPDMSAQDRKIAEKLSWRAVGHGLHFHREGNALYFSYVEAQSGWMDIRLHGHIPPMVQMLEPEAIKIHAELWINEQLTHIKEQRRRSTEYAANPNFPVSIIHDGASLMGRIFLVENATLHVRLESPYQGENQVRFGWAAAMGGLRIWREERDSNNNPLFSEYAIKTARRLMIETYKRAKDRADHQTLEEKLAKLNRR